MAFKLFGDVRETSTTGGTGDQVLTGSAFDASYFRFADRYVDADTFFYGMKQGAKREFGLGTRVASGDKISRTRPYKSTNANALVNFDNGQTIDIYVTNIPPDDLDAAGRLLVLQDLTTLSFESPQPLLTTTQRAQLRANAGVAGINRVDNGTMILSIRNGTAPTVTANNAFFADRWRYLGEASATTYSGDTGLIPAGNAAIQFNGTTDKGGIFQVIEGVNCKDLRGKTVTLSFGMNFSGLNIANIKAAILQWGGTEDATTASPVASWGADGVTPTLATNWSYANAPTNLYSVLVASSFASVTASLGGGFNNLAVLIWNDDKSYTTGDYFRVGNVQIEEGGVATPFENEHISIIKSKCERYCRAWSNGGAGSTYNTFAMGVCVGGIATTADFPFRYDEMRAAPSLSYSALSDFAVMTNGFGGATVVDSSLSLFSSGRFNCTIRAVCTGTPFTPGAIAGLGPNATANAKILLSADI